MSAARGRFNRSDICSPVTRENTQTKMEYFKNITIWGHSETKNPVYFNIFYTDQYKN